jgi:hypothetical protein
MGYGHKIILKEFRAGPVYALATSHASYLFQASRNSPKYPVNALIPHGEFMGLQIGDKADILVNRSGLFSPIVSAPCPPF